MRWWMMAALGAALALSAGCDDGGRQRAEVGDGDMPGADAGPANDGGAAPRLDLGTPPGEDSGVDAELDPDDGAPDAALPDEGLEPDMAPPPPEACNGEDEDGDGRIDEGVSNICGGCDGVPQEGCQAWRINLIQSDDTTLNPNRVVGLQGQALGVSTREIDGAECELVTLAQGIDPDAHLGVVNIDASIQDLNLIPAFDPDRGGFVYTNNPELLRVAVYAGGEEVGIRTGGGAQVGPINETITTPAVLDGIGQAGLAAIAAAARGERDADTPIRLEWAPAEPQANTSLRFFIGGSVPVFGPSRVYRAIEFYQLDGRLDDDGAFEMPVEIFDGGVPSSAIWVYAIRESARRIIQGPHSIDVVAGQRIETRVPGALDPPEDAVPPFQITNPDPNDPELVPGEPLAVQWSPLPEGAGPLEITLAYTDPLAERIVQLNCVAEDPAAGELVLPGEFTEGLPGVFSQLSMRWGLSRVPLPAPDRGVFERSVSVLLRLDR